nr:hypothetical protein [Tanacetum cinerariifolium]
MTRLLFCDYHNMVAILEKGEYNSDFHLMVDFLEASPLMYALTIKPTMYVSHILQFWSTARIKTMEEGTKILDTVDGIVHSISESSLRRNLKLRDEDGISSLPDAKLFENLTLMGYNISPNQKFTFQKVADEPASPVRDVSQGEACPTDSGFIADQDRATIAKSSTLPHDSAQRVTSPVADEGSIQPNIIELTVLCPILQRKHSVLLAKFQAQEVEILKLKERVKVLEDRKGIAATRSRDDAPIKGRNMDEGKAATERISDNTEEMATVLTSIDAATVLVGGIDDVLTGSGFIPTAGPPAADILTGSEVVPTASLVFATANVVTPYSIRKGKEVMVESDTPKKQRLQENNETIAKYLQEYQQFAAELPLERRIELISNLVKYQENYAKIYKFQCQQRRSWTKKQKRDYYMAVIKNNLGWKVKDFKGMTFEEVEAKFNSVYKQMEDFIPMGSKEEAERYIRKAIRFDQESSKKLKSSEEVIEEAKSTDEIPEEKIKEMMKLIPIEEVYVEALQVKHLIIDWKVHKEGQMSYWKIIRLGGSSACYQFFVDLLKHLDRENLNQLWILVKEYLSIRPASSDKEMELCVEIKRLYEPDPEDQL